MVSVGFSPGGAPESLPYLAYHGLALAVVFCFAVFQGLATAATCTGVFEAGTPALRAAQRAFIFAARLARPSGVNPPFFTTVFAADDITIVAVFSSRSLAHRARAAAAIFSRPPADIVGLPFFAGFSGAGVSAVNAGAVSLKSEASSAWSR